MDTIRWPKGSQPSKFYSTVRRFSPLLLKGSLLSIDPATGASSLPGYALFKAGKLVDSGVIDVDSTLSVQARLHEINNVLRKEFPKPDVLSVEMLRGRMVNNTLHWAVGATISSWPTRVFLEVPIVVWKAVSKTVPSYTKSDEADAIIMGEAILTRARNNN